MTQMGAVLATRPQTDEPDTSGRLYALLRNVREEIVRIRVILMEYSRSGAPLDELSRRLRTTMTREIPGIDQRLTAAAGKLEQNDELADYWSDAVTRICNLWDDVKDRWIAVNNMQAAPDALLGVFDQLIEEIGLVTVPPRLAQNLRGLPVGGAMRFHDEFKDEIPSEAARVRILSWIADHPVQVPGVVDVPAGVVIKASPLRWRRLLSLAGVLAMMLIAFLAAVTTTKWINLLQVGKVPAKAADRAYLLAVAAAYLGAICHLLVAAVKQLRAAKSDKGKSFTALGNFAMWAHVNETYLMVYALLIPVTAYTLILTTGAISLVTLFFVGYSIDSVIEVLLSRFDAVAKTQTQTIAASLGGKSA